MTPVSKAQTIAVLDDAIAFEKAAARAGIPSKKARELAAELGDMPPEQLARVCACAADQRRAAAARAERKPHRRTR